MAINLRGQLPQQYYLLPLAPRYRSCRMLPQGAAMPLVPITEAARQLGVSSDTIARRIKAKKIFARRDNSGKWLVDVASAAPAEPTVAVASSAPLHATAATASSVAGPPVAAPEGVGLVSLDAVRVLLGEHCDRLERQHTAAMSAMERAHSAAMDMMRERTDAAEIRAEQTAEQLADLVDRLSKPWWTKWVGSSKRSTLR